MLLRGIHWSPLFTPDGDGAGGNAGTPPGSESNPGTNANPGGTQGAGQVTFTAEQQDHLNRLVGKARQDGEAAGRTAAEQAATAKATEERTAAERKRQLDAGEFDKVKTSLETDIATVTRERDALAAEVDELTQALGPVVTDRLKLLDDADKLGYPKDQPLVKQLAWLNDPRTAAMLERAAEEQRVTEAKGGFRPPVAPVARGKQAPTVELTREEMRAALGVPARQ